MGMYDSVWVNCPQCNEENEFQSKSGNCHLLTYDLENCPNDIIKDINRHAPIICENCRTAYKVDIDKKKAVVVH